MLKEERLPIHPSPKRILSFIRRFLLELAYIFVVLAILTLAVWKFVELIFE